jgi:hypothetical protein
MLETAGSLRGRCQRFPGPERIGRRSVLFGSTFSSIQLSILQTWCATWNQLVQQIASWPSRLLAHHLILPVSCLHLLYSSSESGLTHGCPWGNPPWSNDPGLSAVISAMRFLHVKQEPLPHIHLASRSSQLPSLSSRPTSPDVWWGHSASVRPAFLGWHDRRCGYSSARDRKRQGANDGSSHSADEVVSHQVSY